jgi:polyhydroxyalkanoate synthase subunit PhaC
MSSTKPISALPAAQALKLPCPVHARGDRNDQPAVSREEHRGRQESESKPQPEPYPADRAFHAALASLTGGISPVALSLAYIDWASHLAAAPQRQIEIAQDALRSARQFFEPHRIFSRPVRGRGP